uniref:Uncharacterized protein n=1 Tax=Pithovirus LCPAC101 TaxID=2506586 RepID=A0A481Z2D2_9VIRU|nr:MAG: hypothetical protein LCPAC101_01550 [Pithovirus LCPAC101]
MNEISSIAKHNMYGYKSVIQSNIIKLWNIYSSHDISKKNDKISPQPNFDKISYKEHPGVNKRILSRNIKRTSSKNVKYELFFE